MSELSFDRCPSSSAAGRPDRCGLFSFPERCRQDDDGHVRCSESSPHTVGGAVPAVAVLRELVAWLDDETLAATERRHAALCGERKDYAELVGESMALGRVVRALTEITARHTTGATS